MGQLRDRMEADLRLRGYSPSTRKIYLLYARQFAKHYGRSPAEMGEDEIRAFLLHLVEVREVSSETYRQARAALKFLYKITLRRPVDVAHLPTRRHPRRLPVVLSGSEVALVLKAVQSDKYRLILTAMYGAGLRVDEACRLQPENIDAKRRLLRIRGKGNRERYTLLSDRLLRELRLYWGHHRPEKWFFPGRRWCQPITPDAVRLVFRKALSDAGIHKKVTPHVLRHSFATHLLETGTDVSVVQAVLGHASLRATQAYAHVRIKHVKNVCSPLDLLGTPAGRILG